MEYICCGAVVGISVLSSVFSVIFCIVHGKGASRKRLVFFTALLCVAAALCFGGNAVLSLFGMGWRCAPFNIMLMLCAALFVVILFCCMGEFIVFKNVRPAQEAAYKQLVFFAGPLAVLALAYFLDLPVMPLFGIPFHIMIKLWGVLITIILFCCMGEFILFKNANPAMGVLHKIPVFSVSALGVLAAVCFGGVALIFFDGAYIPMFTTMLTLGTVLYMMILCCCVGEFILCKNAKPTLIVYGYISLLLAVLVTLVSAFSYFNGFSWRDGLTTHNEQTIVYSNDSHGGSCDWRYYTHINGLVHGAEILQEDGWIGAPPHNYRSDD